MQKLVIKTIETSSLLKELPITLSTAAVIGCALFMAVNPPKTYSKTAGMVDGVVGPSLLSSAQKTMSQLSAPTATSPQKALQSSHQLRRD